MEGRMTTQTRAKECLELVPTNMYGTFSVYVQGSYAYFITFSDDYYRFGYVCRKFDVLDTFIEFKMRSDNLLGIHTVSHFHQIKVICLVSLIFSVGAQDYAPIMCTKVFITKWRSGKKISNLDGHSEIVNRFLNFVLNFFGDVLSVV